jgi:hypothetical protein
MKPANGIRVGCCGFIVSQTEYFKLFRLIEIQNTLYQLPCSLLAGCTSLIILLHIIRLPKYNPLMLDIVKEVVYFFVFIGTFTEGEATLVMAGVMIREGSFTFAGVVAIAVVSSVLSHSSFYLLGYLGGRSFLARLRNLENKILKVSFLVRRYETAGGLYLSVCPRISAGQLSGLRIGWDVAPKIWNAAAHKLFGLGLSPLPIRLPFRLLGRAILRRC